MRRQPAGSQTSQLPTRAEGREHRCVTLGLSAAPPPAAPQRHRKKQKDQERRRHRRRRRGRKSVRSWTVEDGSCATSDTRLKSKTRSHCPRQAQKYITANHHEMPSCAIMTWFLRLNLSASLNPQVVVTIPARVGNRKTTPRRVRKRPHTRSPRATNNLYGAQFGAEPQACVRHSDSGLMTHIPTA